MKHTHLDGWYNVMTGLGTSRDKATRFQFQRNYISEMIAADLWKGSFLCAKAIEIVPKEMTRKGWSLTAQDADEVVAERVASASTKAEELSLRSKIRQAKQYARAYGGSAIFIGAVDGRRYDEPLDLARVRDVTSLVVLKPSELHPVSWYRNIMSPRFGEPAMWRVHPHLMFGDGTEATEVVGQSFEAHESRFITFREGVTSREDVVSENGFGYSIFDRILDTIRTFETGYANISAILQDFAQGVLKLKGLANLMAQGDEAVVQARLQAFELQRSNLRSILLDAEGEDFERKSTSLTDYPATLDRFAQLVASAFDMPVTVLMGESPAGLSATGASDIRLFYDRVSSDQNDQLTPALEWVYKILFAIGGGDPDHWKVSYEPLWQLTKLEEAQRRLAIAQTDQIYISNGVLLPEEVAISRFGSGEYSDHTEIDIELREALRERETEELLKEPEPVPEDLPQPPAADGESDGDGESPEDEDEAEDED